MTDATKRRLSAKQIMSDIRSGMDRTELKSKYGLSEKALELVFSKLLAAGAVTVQDMRHLKSGPEPSALPSHREPVTHQWQCPACNAPQSSEMSECPACGVVVAKFLARPGPGYNDSEVLHTFQQDDEPSGTKRWGNVVASVVVLALIGGAVLVWSAHRSVRKTEIVRLDQLNLESPQQFSNETDPSEDIPDEDSVAEQSVGIDHPAAEVGSPLGPTVDLGPIHAIPREREASTTGPGPTDSTPPPPQRPTLKPTGYVTGVLRQFTAADFRKEVVEASKTLPVVFQFYSDT
jgi:hypothetical protein